MDGYEATRHIRDPASSVSNHTIPIVAMTANAMQGDREACIDAGMDDFISKPVSPEKLQQALSKWLPVSCYGSTAKTEEKHSQETLAESVVNGQGQGLIDNMSFDFNTFRERLSGDEDLMRTVAEAFLPDVQEQVELLKQAVSVRDSRQIIQLAHKMKGSSANVGGLALSAQAQIMEQAGRSGHLQDSHQQVIELEKHFEVLKKEIVGELF